MILSDLLGSPVLDAAGERLGFAIDARFVLDAAPAEARSPEIDARLYGLIVSPHTRSSYLGYDRNGVDAPALIGSFLAWRHRGSFLLLWEDVELLTPGRITARRGYRRFRSGFRPAA
ncbi:PRC-barrel domain containing protein [Sinomonas gamaensis]|jgi:hypothetical protein|uniref:PRC-barrel domain containing protein n=1 Tax=Sinomonas gamaensis TaxID=2565624 RepID=UPI001109ABC9|nr:PRC-barrel domain containing protein [Sinomonas gamaensis]